MAMKRTLSPRTYIANVIREKFALIGNAIDTSFIIRKAFFPIYYILNFTTLNQPHGVQY